MSFNIPYLVSGLFDLSRFGTLCFPGLRKIRGLAKSPCIWGPYPTPRLGIAAPQAVSEISGCGVGAPNPIANHALWKPRAQKIGVVGVPPRMSRS